MFAEKKRKKNSEKRNMSIFKRNKLNQNSEYEVKVWVLRAHPHTVDCFVGNDSQGSLVMMIFHSFHNFNVFFSLDLVPREFRSDKTFVFSCEPMLIKRYF